MARRVVPKGLPFLKAVPVNVAAAKFRGQHAEWWLAPKVTFSPPWLLTVAPKYNALCAVLILIQELREWKPEGTRNYP